MSDKPRALQEAWMNLQQRSFNGPTELARLSP
jgi:hypothetical protein